MGDTHMAGNTGVNDSGYLKSNAVKRSVVVGRHKTSISLKGAFWRELRAIAQERHVHLSELIGDIDGERRHGNLSSALRIFVFDQRRGH